MTTAIWGTSTSKAFEEIRKQALRIAELTAELAVQKRALEMAFKLYYGGPSATVQDKIAELIEQARKEE